MIGRALRYEVAGLQRTVAVPLTVLFAVGGALLGRTMAWLASLAQTYEIDQLVSLDTAGLEVSVPLAVLAYVIATAYVFGRDLSDGTIDVVLTAPLSRDAIVFARLTILLVWMSALALLAAGTDGVFRALLGLTAVDPGSALPVAGTVAAAAAGFATMPLFGWAALRFRGMAAAVGAGIAVYMVAYTIAGYDWAMVLPWTAPYVLATGEGSVAYLAGPFVLLVLGVAACLWQMRRLDVP